MKISVKYLVATIVILVVEVLIGLFVHDRFIRPYVGDILVVILLYTLIRSFVRKRIRAFPLFLFVFACIVEVVQYLNIIGMIGLRGNKLVSTIAGTKFDFLDIICYLIGATILFGWELFYDRKSGE